MLRSSEAKKRLNVSCPLYNGRQRPGSYVIQPNEWSPT